MINDPMEAELQRMAAQERAGRDFRRAALTPEEKKQRADRKKKRKAQKLARRQNR